MRSLRVFFSAIATNPWTLMLVGWMVSLLIVRSVGWSECHNFMKWLEVTHARINLFVDLNSYFLILRFGWRFCGLGVRLWWYKLNTAHHARRYGGKLEHCRQSIDRGIFFDILWLEFGLAVECNMKVNLVNMITKIASLISKKKK